MPNDNQQRTLLTTNFINPMTSAIHLKTSVSLKTPHLRLTLGLPRLPMVRLYAPMGPALATTETALRLC